MMMMWFWVTNIDLYRDMIIDTHLKKQQARHTLPTWSTVVVVVLLAAVVVAVGSITKKSST